MALFEKAEPEAVEIDGRELRCQLCGHGSFWRQRAQLHPALSAFLSFDWANRSAVCFVCAKCGYIHWFLPQE